MVARHITCYRYVLCEGRTEEEEKVEHRAWSGYLVWHTREDDKPSRFLRYRVTNDCETVARYVELICYAKCETLKGPLSVVTRARWYSVGKAGEGENTVTLWILRQYAAWRAHRLLTVWRWWYFHRHTYRGELHYMHSASNYTTCIQPLKYTTWLQPAITVHAYSLITLDTDNLHVHYMATASNHTTYLQPLIHDIPEHTKPLTQLQPWTYNLTKSFGRIPSRLARRDMRAVGDAHLTGYCDEGTAAPTVGTKSRTHAHIHTMHRKHLSDKM